MKKRKERIQQVIQMRWHRDIVMAIFIGIVGSLVALSMFFLSGYMITQSAKGAPLYALMGLIVTVKLFGFIRAIARYYERLRSHRATFTMLRDIRVQLYRSLIPLVPDVFRKFRSSDLLGKMVTHVESLQNVYLRVYYPPIVIGVVTLISACVLIFFSWIHAVVLMITMCLTLLVFPAVQVKQAIDIRQQVNMTQEQWMHEYYDYVSGQEELQRFNSMQRYYTHMKASEQAFSDAEHRAQRGHLKYNYFRDLISMVALLFSLVLAIVMVESQKLDVIYVMSIILMVLTLLEQAVPMSQVAEYKSETDLAQQRLSEVLQHDHAIVGERKTHIAPLPQSALLYALAHTTLYYDTQQRPSVDDLNLQIHKGEHVAIVGVSGSGKSTLLQLLMGLYTPSEGRIMVDDEELQSIDRPAYYAQLNTLLQHPHFYDGTVYENLLTEAPYAHCRKVLDQLGLEKVSLDRHLTLTQNTLSGGEIQRLALARLFLRDCPVWLLDEPTTALDVKHAEEVMAYIHQSAETLVVATHDIQYLNQFDRVIVMNEGRIEADCTPEAFLKGWGEGKES
ncbi:thiol reductant ABC exporter subunit CydC [Staphylococcus lutrae]|uniref:Thiol reductant ABC exporter subunit CydC n=1 Tax=Staphylococcus lutrae TaxID=155085 RepID=A0AAC9WJW2_9STAP|nr:thiol reductant ABC exporter subunit CydC [Staphylococcus lutrae]ARJ51226.1 thiol reductant ABC exporter subunit CydC [Staphylococcus lutrae]PNZ39471.1 thiol reductant ABC exporter subunit CydC [Staphylococcus lutrae]